MLHTATRAVLVAVRSTAPHSGPQAVHHPHTREDRRMTPPSLLLFLALALALAVPTPAEAYIGPRAGFAVGGSLLAVFAATMTLLLT